MENNNTPPKGNDNIKREIPSPWIPGDKPDTQEGSSTLMWVTILDTVTGATSVGILNYLNKYVMGCADNCDPPDCAVPRNPDDSDFCYEYEWTCWTAGACEYCETEWVWDNPTSKIIAHASVDMPEPYKPEKIFPLFHVTTARKAKLYRQTGWINTPVRGFDTLMAAMAWAMKTGRKVIMQVDPSSAPHLLPDHHSAWGKAWWTESVPISRAKCVYSAEGSIPKSADTSESPESVSILKKIERERNSAIKALTAIE